MIICRHPFLYDGREYRPGDELTGRVAELAMRDGMAVNVAGEDVQVFRAHRERAQGERL